MQLTLVMFTATGERRDFTVRHRKATIGRNTECDIQVQLEIVSRRHCELIVNNGSLVVRDLGSSNGTYVNNKRVQETQLQPGDTLTVGPVVFTVVIDGEPDKVTPVRTMLNNQKKSPAPRKHPTPQPVKNSKPALDETGQIDLSGSSEMDIVVEHDDNDNDSDALSELAALSKQKKL